MSDTSSRSLTSMMRKTPDQRVGMNAQGRFIAHWDEFVEHRRDINLKVTEVMQSLEERRDASLQLESHVGGLRNDLFVVVSRFEKADRVQADHQARLVRIEQKLWDSPSSNTRQGNESTPRQRRELQLDEGESHHRHRSVSAAERMESHANVAGVLRLRSEVDAAVREAVGAAQATLRQDLLAVCEAVPGELQAMCTALGSGLADYRCRSREEADELRHALAQVRNDNLVSCEEATVLAADVQRQIADFRATIMGQSTAASDSALSSVTRRSYDELEARVGNVQEKVRVLHNDSTESIAELRREMHRAELAQATLQSRRFSETTEKVQQETDALRSEVRASVFALQSDTKGFDEQIIRCSRQFHDLSQRHSEDLGRVEERLSLDIKSRESDMASVQQEIAKLASLGKERSDEVMEACHCLITDELRSHEARLSDALLVQKESFANAMASAVVEPCMEVKTLRSALASHEAGCVARMDQLGTEISRQGAGATSELQQEIRQLNGRFEERLASASEGTRKWVTDQSRQAARDIDEQIKPWCARLAQVEKLSDATPSQQCERLHQVCTELAAGQEVLAQQAMATARELGEVRSAGCHALKSSPEPSVGCIVASREVNTSPGSSSSARTFGRRLSWKSSLHAAVAEAEGRLMAKFPEESVSPAGSTTVSTRSRSMTGSYEAPHRAGIRERPRSDGSSEQARSTKLEDLRLLLEVTPASTPPLSPRLSRTGLGASLGTPRRPHARVNE